jgi:hypothetical protein
MQREGDRVMMCEFCKGRLWISHPYWDGSHGYRLETIACPNCSGTKALEAFLNIAYGLGHRIRIYEKAYKEKGIVL